jgi:hypothetical protein
VKAYEVGDLVLCTSAFDLKTKTLGIVIKTRENEGPFNMHVYHILSLGHVRKYTAAAVRSLNGDW